MDPCKKGAGSQLWGRGSVIRGSVSQTRGAGSDIRRDPPNLTPEQERGCSVHFVRLAMTLLNDEEIHETS